MAYGIAAMSILAVLAGKPEFRLSLSAERSATKLRASSYASVILARVWAKLADASALGITAPNPLDQNQPRNDPHW